jgi:hypothetical protein
MCSVTKANTGIKLWIFQVQSSCSTYQIITNALVIVFCIIIQPDFCQPYRIPLEYVNTGPPLVGGPLPEDVSYMRTWDNLQCATTHPCLLEWDTRKHWNVRGNVLKRHDQWMQHIILWIPMATWTCCFKISMWMNYLALTSFLTVSLGPCSDTYFISLLSNII